MNEMEAANAAAAMATSALSATLSIAQMLIEKGLLGPEDVDALSQAILLPYEVGSRGDQNADAERRATMEAMVLPALAALNRLAREKQARG